ncbi:major facilitator superfamily domain-containing protein, partial [Dimargaris cristalligena]
IYRDMLLYGIVVPVLPDILPEMVDNVSQANGFLFGIYALGLMFGGFVFGGLSDRYQVRQVPMCILLLVLGVATLLFGIAKEYYQLLIARLIQGLAGGGTWAIGFGMILDMNSPSKSIAILGSVMACSSMGTLLGPTLGGFLYEGGGRMAPFVFGGCLAFLDLILRLFIGETAGWKERQAEIEAEEEAARQAAKMAVNVQRKPTTVREMMTSWQLVMCFLTTMAASLSTTSLETVLPLHLKDRLGLSAGPIGLLFMAAVIPNAIVSPVMGWLMSRFHWDRHLVMSCSILYLAAMLPLTSLPTQVWTQVIVLLFTGFGLASVLFSPTPHMIHYMSENSNDCYALLSAINNVFYAGGMLVGPILSGALYERMSFLNCMLILIAFLITLSIII